MIVFIPAEALTRLLAVGHADSNKHIYRLAFYYRIFPIRLFRHILVCVAALSLSYGVAIDVAILFQW